MNSHVMMKEKEEEEDNDIKYYLNNIYVFYQFFKLIYYIYDLQF